jgi:predicted unusual protein kinase regulating ubiquinone biosynthesis (AarF/ABC1/UbiB family)
MQSIIDDVTSRRRVIGSSGLAVFSLLAASVSAEEGVDMQRLKEAQEKTAQRARETARMGAAVKLQEKQGQQEREFFEKMRDSDAESRTRLMQDWQFQKTIERLKTELCVSDEEWAVVKPRLESVYCLAYLQLSHATIATETLNTLKQRTETLRRLLLNEQTTPDQIKNALTALRSAREGVRQELTKARQELRKIMTLRQEAVLVLSGLLD